MVGFLFETPVRLTGADEENLAFEYMANLPHPEFDTIASESGTPSANACQPNYKNISDWKEMS